MSTDELRSRALSRRTLVSAAAWSVPVIAMAGALPAVAASVAPRPAVGTVAAAAQIADSVTTSGTLSSSQAKQTGWVPPTSCFVTGATSGFVSAGDSSAATSPVVITAGYTINAIAGVRYLVTFSAAARYDNATLGTEFSERQSVVVDAVPASGSSSVIKKVTVKHADVNWVITRTDAQMTGYELLDPSDGTKTYTGTFDATASGLVTIRYTFTLDKRAWSLINLNSVSDDLWVSAPAVTVSAWL